MHTFISWLRKIGIVLIAVPLFIVGVILIPLPGPGLLVCFAAVFLLSLEFDQAKPLVERLRRETKRLADAARERTGKSPKK